MSQANDVAKGRHFRYYLARGLPRAAKCEPHHAMRATEGLPIVSRMRRFAGGEKTANRFRVSWRTRHKNRKALTKHSNRGPNYVTFARRCMAGGRIWS